MTINADLLIAAPMLQDYLVDKDTGFPLAGGIITLWVDDQRYVEYKNWYYQTGSPGAYEWIALDNPLSLSSVGTIQDPNGNDVIPFYYPFEENNENVPQKYFITVYSVDENGDPAVLQFTRENFPYVSEDDAPGTLEPTLRNYILNNVYWRNIGSLDCMLVTDAIIAPSQHDGYTNGDIRFLKDITGANDDLIFNKMSDDDFTLDDDITPEYYLNMQCSGIQGGEQVKCIQYPVSLHIDTLQNVNATLVLHAQNVEGSSNNYVDVYVYQYLGTGALSQPDPILIERITLNDDWTLYPITFTFPDAEGLALGDGGDDALFIRIQYPLSALFNINHTKPQLYLSARYPDNDFDTYDQIETIINSPRTGDVRTSLNSFTPYGWVPMNNTSIGSATSSATGRRNIDTWPLFNLLWQVVSDVFAPVSGGKGANPYADFSANKNLTLTFAAGRAILGLPVGQTFTYVNGTGIFTVPTSALFYAGAPVYLTNTGGHIPTGFALNTIYYTIPLTGSTLQLASSYALAIARTALVPASDNGTGTNAMSFALGGTVGEAGHTPQEIEMFQHSHSLTGGNFLADGGGSAFNTFASAGTPVTTHAATATKGSSVPFNIVQPSIYFNTYLKL